MADRLSKLEKAYRRNPDSPLFARLADLYLRRGMVFRALDICQQGCEQFPDYITGFLVLSRCHEAQGELEEARKAMGRALRLDPENPSGFKRLSRIYQELGKPDLALKSLEQAARLDPLDHRVNDQIEQVTHTLWQEEIAEKRETFDLLPAEVEAETVADEAEPPEPAEAVAVPDEPEETEVATDADAEGPPDAFALELAEEEGDEEEEWDEGEEEEISLFMGDGDPSAEDRPEAEPADELEPSPAANVAILGETDEPLAEEIEETEKEESPAEPFADLVPGTDREVIPSYQEEEEEEEKEALPASQGQTTDLTGSDSFLDEVAALGAVIFDEPPEIAENGDTPSEEAPGDEAPPTPPSPAVETERVESVSDLDIDADLQESGEGMEAEAATQEEFAAEDRDQSSVPRSRRPREGGAHSVSGLAPRDDDELIKLFKEIETQQTQELFESAADQPSGIPSIPLDEAEDEDSERQIATVTLAEIYAIQGLTQRAIDTYRQLLAHDPDNEDIKAKLAALEEGDNP